MKILDTDTCVAILRGHGPVLQRARVEPEPVATTWITAAELMFGAAKSRAPEAGRAAVVRFLATLPVLELDLVAARLFGDTKALLEAKGARLADADLLVGAVALARGAVVVSGNLKHLARIPGLTVENWIR